MALKQTLLMLDVLDHPEVSGEQMVQLCKGYEGVKASYQTVRGERGVTDFVNMPLKYGSKTYLQTLGATTNE